MKKSPTDAPACSVDYAFRRIGGKYKGRIIWYLHSHDNLLRYGAFRRIMKDITPKMLTQTLRELEDDQLISRTVYHEVPPKVEYSLTATGKELVPLIDHLRQWGDRQIEREKQRLTSPDSTLTIP